MQAQRLIIIFFLLLLLRANTGRKLELTGDALAVAPHEERFMVGVIWRDEIRLGLLCASQTLHLADDRRRDRGSSPTTKKSSIIVVVVEVDNIEIVLQFFVTDRFVVR